MKISSYNHGDHMIKMEWTTRIQYKDQDLQLDENMFLLAGWATRQRHRQFDSGNSIDQNIEKDND